MKMLSTLAILVLALSARAELTVTPTVVSQYMFRGVRVGGPAFQPSVEYDQGNLALGLWANQPIADKTPGVSDPELDLYGSYSFPLTPSLSLAPGFTWYNYPRAVRADGLYKQTIEPNVALTYTFGALKLTPKYYYDLTLRGPTYEFAATYTVDKAFDVIASAGTFRWTDAAEDTTPAVKNWGNYWSVGVNVPIVFSEKSKLLVGVSHNRGTGNYTKQGNRAKELNDAAVGRVVYSLGYAYTF